MLDGSLGEIVALGGGGVGGQMILRIGGFILSAISKGQQAHAAEEKYASESWKGLAKVTQNVRGAGSNWVYHMFAVTCVFIVVSPLVLPMLMDVTIHFFVPKDQGLFAWLSFDKAKLTEYVIPEIPSIQIVDGLELAKATRHVALFPFMYSFASNVSWFWISGRPFADRF
jgi:hypothetical protein